MSRRAPVAATLDDAEVISTPNPKGVGGLPSRRSERSMRADEDVVRTPLDRQASGKPPRDKRGRAARREAARDAEDVVSGAAERRDHVARDRTSRGYTSPRRPAVWAAVETMHSPTPVYGAFPVRFLPWALRLLRAQPSEVLHVCSGALTAEDVRGGTRVDIRPEARPDVVADGRALPFADASFRAVLIDPPYSVEYARDLYGTEYPRPSHLLREAARVVSPCGRIGMLHFLVPSPPPGCRIVAVRGVTQGCGYRIRALTIYEREQDGLPGLDDAETRS